MNRTNLIYLITLIIGFIAAIFFIFIPIVNILIQFNTHPIWFIIVVCGIIPFASVALIYLILDFIRTIQKESRDEEMKKVVGNNEKKVTEREILKDLEFENKKTIIFGTLKQLSELKETSIIYFEEISESTTYPENEVEDFVILLLADGIIQGDVYFDQNDKGCIKLKSRQFKVKYNDKSKE